MMEDAPLPGQVAAAEEEEEAREPAEPTPVAASTAAAEQPPEASTLAGSVSPTPETTGRQPTPVAEEALLPAVIRAGSPPAAATAEPATASDSASAKLVALLLGQAPAPTEYEKKKDTFGDDVSDLSRPIKPSPEAAAEVAATAQAALQLLEGDGEAVLKSAVAGGLLQSLGKDLEDEADHVQRGKMTPWGRWLRFDDGESANRPRVLLVAALLRYIGGSDGVSDGDRATLLGGLGGAQLQGANLSAAQLQEACLSGAQLQKANLSGTQLQKVDLRGAQLQGADLSRAQLQKANLSDYHNQAQLQEARLFKADLQEACLSHAQLQKVNLSGTQLQKADLSRAQLQGADLSDAQLQKADLSRAQLQKADLSRAQLQKAQLGDAQLQKAIMLYVQLQEASLHGAQLQEANLTNAQLQEANLQKAQLQGAILSGAQLQKVVMFEAQLQEANLSSVRLQNANLSEAKFHGAILSEANLQGADLTNAQLQELAIPAQVEVSTKEVNLERVSQDDEGDNDSKSHSLMVGDGVRAKHLVGLVPKGSEGTVTKIDTTTVRRRTMRTISVKFTVEERTIPAATLDKCDLSGATCDGANITGVSMKEANFSDFKLPPKRVPTKEEPRIGQAVAKEVASNRASSLLDSNDDADEIDVELGTADADDHEEPPGLAVLWADAGADAAVEILTQLISAKHTVEEKYASAVESLKEWDVGSCMPKSLPLNLTAETLKSRAVPKLEQVCTDISAVLEEKLTELLYELKQNASKAVASQQSNDPAAESCSMALLGGLGIDATQVIIEDACKIIMLNAKPGIEQVSKEAGWRVHSSIVQARKTNAEETAALLHKELLGTSDEVAPLLRDAMHRVMAKLRTGLTHKLESKVVGKFLRMANILISQLHGSGGLKTHAATFEKTLRTRTKLKKEDLKYLPDDLTTLLRKDQIKSTLSVKTEYDDSTGRWYSRICRTLGRVACKSRAVLTRHENELGEFCSVLMCHAIHLPPQRSFVVTQSTLKSA